MTTLPKNLADRADALATAILGAIERQGEPMAGRLLLAYSEGRFRLEAPTSGRAIVRFPDEQVEILVRLEQRRSDA